MAFPTLSTLQEAPVELPPLPRFTGIAAGRAGRDPGERGEAAVEQQHQDEPEDSEQRHAAAYWEGREDPATLALRSLRRGDRSGPGLYQSQSRTSGMHCTTMVKDSRREVKIEAVTQTLSIKAASS